MFSTPCAIVVVCSALILCEVSRVDSKFELQLVRLRKSETWPSRQSDEYVLLERQAIVNGIGDILSTIAVCSSFLGLFLAWRGL